MLLEETGDSVKLISSYVHIHPKDDTRINPAERRIFAGFQLVSDSSVNYQQLLDNEPVYEDNVS